MSDDIDPEITAVVKREKGTFVRLCPADQDSTLTVLRIHLLTEYYLERLLSLLLPRGDKLITDGSLSYHQKLIVVAAFDVLSDANVQALRGLNRVRNRCAHEMDTTISTADVELIGRSLGEEFTTIRREHGADAKKFLREILSTLCRNVSYIVYHLENKHIAEHKKKFEKGERRSNHAMQRTAPRSKRNLRVVSSFSVWRRALPGAVADLVSR